MRTSINGEIMSKPYTKNGHNYTYVYKMIDGKKTFIRAENCKGQTVAVGIPTTFGTTEIIEL